ncbi:MAG TPA: four helix bundle protein [Patescibacteria group bacterium]|nr:four helix bundle protein [Patescibacteria group bacterium]
MAFRFRQFPIYLELRAFVLEIYKLSETFPKEEQYALSSQLKRAATSSVLNIAEGSMKKSDAEFNRFILISAGSISEVVAIMDLCLDLKYISTSQHAQFMLKCENIIKQLYGFSRKLK